MCNTYSGRARSRAYAQGGSKTRTILRASYWRWPIVAGAVGSQHGICSKKAVIKHTERLLQEAVQ